MESSKESILSKVLIARSESGGGVKNYSFSKGGNICLFCVRAEHSDSLGTAVRAVGGQGPDPVRRKVCPSTSWDWWKLKSHLGFQLINCFHHRGRLSASEGRVRRKKAALSPVIELDSKDGEAQK